MKTTASIVSVLLATGLLANVFAQDGGRSRVVPPPAGQGPGSGVQQDGDVVTILADSKGVIFSVVDERNRIVSDLKASDIEILDGGARQEIDIFRTSNDLPMMLAVLIDTSASQESLLPAEKRAVDVFLDSSFRTGKDFGAVLTFQGETTLVNGLTTNLRQLKSALGRIEREQQFRDESNATPQLGTALYDAVEITAKEVLDGKTARRVTTAGRSAS
jgi:Ca-activated chloride channel homolog